LKEKKKSSNLFPRHIRYPGFLIRKVTRPSLSAETVEKSGTETKQNNNDTPHFVLDNHKVDVSHYVPTHVPRTMSSEWVINLKDAHELFSCIQTDREEVIRPCGVALLTRRIEVWARSFIHKIWFADKCRRRTKCLFNPAVGVCKIFLPLVREVKFIEWQFAPEYLNNFNWHLWKHINGRSSKNCDTYSNLISLLDTFWKFLRARNLYSRQRGSFTVFTSDLGQPCRPRKIRTTWMRYILGHVQTHSFVS
jgi:hypothetical protein